MSSDGLVRKNCHVEKPFFTMKVHGAKQIKWSILATKLSVAELSKIDFIDGVVSLVWYL